MGNIFLKSQISHVKYSQGFYFDRAAVALDVKQVSLRVRMQS